MSVMRTGMVWGGCVWLCQSKCPCKPELGAPSPWGDAIHKKLREVYHAELRVAIRFTQDYEQSLPLFGRIAHWWFHYKTIDCSRKMLCRRSKNFIASLWCNRYRKLYYFALIKIPETQEDIAFLGMLYSQKANGYICAEPGTNILKVIYDVTSNAADLGDVDFQIIGLAEVQKTFDRI